VVTVVFVEVGLVAVGIVGFEIGFGVVVGIVEDVLDEACFFGGMTVCVIEFSVELLACILSATSRLMTGGISDVGLSFNVCSVCHAIIAAADKVFVWCGFLYSKKKCYFFVAISES